MNGIALLLGFVVGGRGDGENNNFGLVTVDDEPYDDFAEPVAVTNARAPHLPR